jgi:pyruvate/2-oxoglutarate dehydrogenase complex dihydrolipoamide dehydrogenase (E3) component
MRFNGLSAHAGRFDERLQTNVPAIWAIGECAGSPQFTHFSVDDFWIG